VEILPLLSHEIVASQLLLTGASIHIVRYEDGRLNIDDLLGGEGPPPQFDVRGVKVERSLLSYTDRGTKATYELADLTFNAPRLANSVQTPIEAAFAAREVNGAFLVRVNVQGRLAMDVGARRYTLGGSAIELDGRVPGMPHVSARLKGDAMARLDAGEIELSGITCSLSGKVRDEELTMTLDAGKLVAQGNRARGETLRVSLAATGTSGTTAPTIASQTATRDDDWVRAREATVDISLTRGERHFRGALTAALEADMAARTLALMDMRSKFNVSGAGLPRKGIAGAAHGEARIDAVRESVQLALAGGVDESKVRAQVKASGFAAPVYAFNVSIDELDADRYIADSAESRRKTVAASESASVLEPLVQLRATGTVTVGTLKSAGVSARNVRFEVK
jgi:AsmA protein